MFFDELMFEHSEQMKLEVFHSLSTVMPGEYQLYYFAEQHALTYHQISKLIGEIDKDIEQMYPQWKKLLIGNGKVRIPEKRMKLDKYRFHLWRQTVPYQFIEAVFLGREINVIDFCKEKGIGRSTLYRKLLNLIDFLKEFDIKVNYNPIDFIGEEALIRIIFSYLFWIGSRGIDTPEFANKELANQMLQRNIEIGYETESYIGHKQLLMSLYVANARLETGHFVEKKVALSSVFSETPLFESKILGNLPFIPKGKMEDELYFYYFFVYILHSYSDVNDVMIGKIIDIFLKKQKNHVVTQLVERYLQSFDKNKLQMTPDQFRVLTANLLAIAYSYYVYEHPLPDLESLTIPVNLENKEYIRLVEKNKEFFERTLKEPQFEKFQVAQGHFVRRFTNMTLPYLIHFDSINKLQLGIALENNPILQNNLKVFLNRLNFVELEPFQIEKAEEYDVVIHSSSIVTEELPNIQHSFLWDIGYGEKEMYWLYTSLHKLYLEKQ
ncbi:Mga helix-turn-helix domain-containing protein [Pilibacter termitis]|uniref:Mga helix-turn-helix domain-containing protein n=1 Tax=Pilibacter termitis TaxID=263852 RepID=A0A1T4KPS0_9ENTE|nr:helix-turn-helix domain-containing protein [Pilibacter termitis]SJZ44429.1 Mga helix-turn-helix domain-containing protein [Pilibacter termitis]